MKKFTALLFALLLMTALFAGCAPAHDDPPSYDDPTSPSPEVTPETPPPVVSDVDWISPMLSISTSSNEASVFSGDPLIEIPGNDFGRENRGMIAAEMPEEGQEVVPAQLTASDLEARGAVKMTANFAYEGDGEYPVRFRVRADQFQGHSITSYGLTANTGILVLWQDTNGIWWNIRRTGWGGPFTGGSNESGVAAFTINKETAGNFAVQDFYIIVLEEVPFRTNAEGVATDYQSGYVITYQAELPDHDGHFHNFNVLASSSIYIQVPPSDK